ncbi:hypothetical protein ACHAXR_004116, partial [Thalassiosira sp. AJA248-18]
GYGFHVDRVLGYGYIPVNSRTRTLLDGLVSGYGCQRGTDPCPRPADRRPKSKTRSKSNLSIVTEHLYTQKSTSESNQWDSGLNWLSTVYQPQPPPFRQSLLLHLKHKLLDTVVDAYRDLITATVEASNPSTNPNDAHSPPYDSTPLWLLCILFEQLILAPRAPQSGPAQSAESTTQCIYRRLRWLRAGRIADLYSESRKVVSKPPSSLQSSAEQNEAFIEKSAQLAADNDNFGTANDRLTKATPVAIINDANIHALHALHPRETYPPSAPSRRRTRRQTAKALRFRNSNEIVFTASTIVNDILHLKKGKAPGLQVDSLDLFIHLAQRCRNGSAKKKKLTPFASTLANFFTIVANADYPDKIQSIFRTTYLVALQKDPNDLTKLRPLGIPAAIRRVTANAIANELKSTFASHLLPYNYAVGIHGGVDFITTTLRLGVEKYVSNQTDIGLLPSRALVSLDIRNMFNAISRHKLREIVRDDFPCLQSFVDSLYATPGKSCVKMSDGGWEDIVVSEGFSQGCPLSPILAAIVLNYILKKVDAILKARAKSRPAANSDDGLGGLAIILAYVDDANFLVPLEDVEPLLQAFKSVAEPLGAIMNTEKTRILTSTSGTSILPQLLLSNPTLHDSISSAISTFSRKTNSDNTTPPSK